jgi:iron-sulfur cluster assembly accessory protein
MTTNAQQITKEMTIQELFTRFPAKAQKLALELSKTGLNCVGCSASTWETLESGVMRHGLTEKDLDTLLSKLNTILEEETDLETISLTARAAEKYQAICAADGKEGWGLRFDERPAGCSGFEYVLDFSEKADPEDVIYTSNGVEIHVHSSVVGRLLGSEIDFVEGLQSGFKIVNPNVGSSCGCGSSHGYN